MTNWQTRLAEQREKSSERPPCILTKPPKAPFVSFGSLQTDHSRQISASTNTRTHLLALAEAEGLDTSLVHELTTADVDACDGLPDSALVSFLHARQATAEREAGRVPTGWTAPILCRSCGPVWVHPDAAGVLPVVNGWPRALGCPWCVIRIAGKTVPRPPITSSTCKHWTPDTVNPEAGMGTCRCGSHFPNERHHCADYQPGAMP